MKKGLSIAAAILLLFQICAFAETDPQQPSDSTTFYGDYIKENEVRELTVLGDEAPFAFVLCKTLNVHAQKELSSEVVGTLEYAKEVEVLEKSDDAYYIHFYEIISDVVFDKYGWISKAYVLLDPPCLIANHPTPIFALPQEDAKKLGYLSTYDSLRVIGEVNDYYIVSCDAAAGFVKKE